MCYMFIRDTWHIHKSALAGKCSSLEDLYDLTCMNVDLVYLASSDNVDGFLTLRVDPLEEGVLPVGFGPVSIYADITSCSTPGLASDMGRAIVMESSVRMVFGCIDYEIPELGSDDLVMGSGLCSWSPTVALHVLLNSGVEAALMYLDSFKLPNCTRTPHVGRSEA
ncbi:hypothetical protein M9H77_08073 [Catharanthus roseus]|uniref:Uncharacterized protein n=1 Tax=Catharanthus roseus TaxID=4058 RepID=A0ACC0BWR7_CATRO|nr:hypothetical protein M9H77_08073 [Catharanthus roseus]